MKTLMFRAEDGLAHIAYENFNDRIALCGTHITDQKVWRCINLHAVSHTCPKCWAPTTKTKDAKGVVHYVNWVTFALWFTPCNAEILPLTPVDTSVTCMSCLAGAA